MNKDDKKALIEKALFPTPALKRKFSAFVNPLKKNIDYQSVGRKTFLVEPKVCKECGATYTATGVHPDNDCPLGKVEKVMDE